MNLLDKDSRYDFCVKELIPVVVKSSEITKEKIRIIEKKGHGNFVTDIDKHIEEYLKQELSSLLPDSGFVGEESGASKDNSDYLWIIDPIDGTTNYIYGYPYAISVALKSTQNDELLIGVVVEPKRECVYFGCKEKGSYKLENGVISRLSIGTFPENEGVIIFGMPYDRKKSTKILGIVDEYYSIASDMKRIGPSSLDICRVASGNAKLYLELDLNIWDVSAGIVILQEAGGNYIVKDDLTIFYSDEKYVLNRENNLI